VQAELRPRQSNSTPSRLSRERRVLHPPLPGFCHSILVSVSKSWSDMWEEDEEEEQEEQKRQALQELNSRTWSHESRGETKKADKPVMASAPQDINGNIDDDLLADGFFFHDAMAARQSTAVASPRYSPPSKRGNFDKWVALGERRRAPGAVTEPETSPESKSRRQFGFGLGGYNKFYEAGVWDQSNFNNNNINTTMNKQWSKERVKDCPWNKGRDWNWRRDRRTDLGDVEWVGGW